MATHSSILAWEIPWTEEAGGLQSMGSQRVSHELATEQQQEVVKPIVSLAKGIQYKHHWRQSKSLDWFQSFNSKSESIVIEYQSRIRLLGTRNTWFMPNVYIFCKFEGSGASEM